jgi:hypothetical protein
MHEMEKQIYDRLVKAEWLENVKATESTEQPGVHERMLQWRMSKNIIECGEFKLWLFSKLQRELALSGPISEQDLNLLVQMGAAFGILKGWEKAPPL